MASVAEQQLPDLREPAGWRRTKNRIALVLMWVAFALVIIPLGFVLYTVIAKGASIISWQFLTSSIPFNVAPANVGGMGPAVLGTILITEVQNWGSWARPEGDLKIDQIMKGDFVELIDEK